MSLRTKQYIAAALATAIIILGGVLLALVIKPGGGGQSEQDKMELALIAAFGAEYKSEGVGIAEIKKCFEAKDLEATAEPGTKVCFFLVSGAPADNNCGGAYFKWNPTTGKVVLLNAQPVELNVCQDAQA